MGYSQPMAITQEQAGLSMDNEIKFGFMNLSQTKKDIKDK